MKKHSTTFLLNSQEADNINGSKTSMTWSNIDIRTILGSIYDEYEHYDIQLNSVVCLTGTDTEANKNLIIYLSGLPFLGIGNSGKMPIGLNKTGTATTSSLVQLSGEPKNTFHRPNNTTSITINLFSISTNQLSTTNLGDQVYLFTITGNSKF